MWKINKAVSSQHGNVRWKLSQKQEVAKIAGSEVIVSLRNQGSTGAEQNEQKWKLTMRTGEVKQKMLF